MIKNLIFLVQIRLLKLSYYSMCLCNIKETDKWVIGVEEIASFLNNMSTSLDMTDSVCLYGNPFYQFSYDIYWSSKTVFHKLALLVIGPVMLAYLINKYQGFIYLGSKGFLISDCDGRNAEFDFIKAKSKGIVTVFLGSEIRSHVLQRQYAQDNDIELVVSYQEQVNPGIGSPDKEALRQKIGESADQYADVIFNPSIDQMTYIKRKTLDTLYFYPTSLFNLNNDKWLDAKRLKIFHAPSSPIIKGTPLVRAAIKKLRLEGYDFDYQELSGVSHNQILKVLASSHIVLNEFYAQVPGVFGVEAMANGCVLLTSADRNIEPSLPLDSDRAWVVTPYWDVYIKLKSVLDMPVDSLRRQAETGFEWALKNYSSTENAGHFKMIIGDES
ncbi:MAG TPA: hypothetical protein DCS80_09895 [Betaproteobacteria bacterium]|jgi:hypothetical protein|nr:hypothetical protein [Betaproteobacteria bacterium]